MTNSTNNSKYYNYNSFSYIICFIVGFIYCSILTFGNAVIQNIATISFVIFLVFLFIKNIKEINKYENLSPKFLFIQIIILNMSIALAAAILNSPTSFFWVQDSMLTHLPVSQGYANYILGNIPNLDAFRDIPGVSTHALTGLFIALFGTSTFITVFVQLIYKLIIVFFVYKTCEQLWNKKIGLVAIQLYGLCPTIFFYNLVLYKEGAVQAFLAMIIYFSLKIFQNKKFIYIIPLLLALALLQNERFYIFYLLLALYPLLIFNLPFKKSILNISILTTVIIVAAVIFYKYYPQSMDIYKIKENLISKRNKWASYSDVLNQYNYGIPYPLAFLKITFSPYFTFNKFKIFSDFSLLLIWGSFINQIIILTSIMGLIKTARKAMIHFILWVPFILFLLFAAYISPWSGRLRDSFYPLIVCYSAYYLMQNDFFKRKLFIKSTIDTSL